MGILTDYDIDLDEYEANEGGFTNPDPGWYEFQVTDIRIYSKEDGSWSGIFVDYLLTSEELGVAGEEYSEIFGLPKHNPPTKQERAALERYKARILSFGFEESEVNDVDGESVRGLTGTFELEESRGRDGKKYVNVRHLTVDGAEDDGSAEDGPGNRARAHIEPDDEPEPPKRVTKAAPAKGTAAVAPKQGGKTTGSRFQRG